MPHSSPIGNSEPEQSVRLINEVRGNDRVEGIVEILYDGRWGLLCSPPSTFEVAASICDGLGFGRSSNQFTPSK